MGFNTNHSAGPPRPKSVPTGLPSANHKQTKSRKKATMATMRVVSVRHHDGQAEKVAIASSSSSLELANLLCERFSRERKRETERDRERANQTNHIDKYHQQTAVARENKTRTTKQRYPPTMPRALSTSVPFCCPRFVRCVLGRGWTKAKFSLFISKNVILVCVGGAAALLYLSWHRQPL